MPRKSSQKNRTNARKAAQKAAMAKQKQKRGGIIAHHRPGGLALALLVASMLRADQKDS